MPETQHATDAGHPAGRIGPNAIIQVAEVLAGEREGRLAQVMKAAGLDRYLGNLPDGMVDEAEVTALQAALRSELGIAEARRISFEAGLRTGDYLLANRIPRPAQMVLKFLPAGMAAPMLIAAIRRHSWTFAGSGTFSARPGNPLEITIADSPLCRGTKAREPLCDFYAGTFQRLFSTLVHRRATARETACTAAGAPACTFRIQW